MARDDFSLTTKKMLCDQVGGKCSNPDCRVITIGPSADDSKRTTIGVAAHITAASEGGPRYDPGLTPKERRAAENGIWLCQNHAREIDANEVKYSVAKLKGWKQRAIALADEEIGKRQLSYNEAQELAVTQLKTFSGLSENISDYSNLLHNVHAGTSRSIENIDPRFAVATAFTNGVTHYRIEARENVKVDFEVAAPVAQDFNTALKRLKSHADEVNVSAEHLDIKGSPLFQKIFKPQGKLTISPIGRKAVLKISFKENTGNIVQFDDVQGEIVLGSEAAKFSGEMFNGIVSVKCNAFFRDSQFSINLTNRWAAWNGNEINCLPFFSKALNFYNSFIEGAVLSLSIEVDGEEWFSFGGSQQPSELLRSEFALLKYLNAARTICTKTGTKIIFDINNVEYSHQDYLDTIESAELFESPRVFGGSDINTKCRTSIKVTEPELIKSLLDERKPTELQMTAEKPVIYLLGVEVSLPPKLTHLRNVYPKLLNETMDFVAGDDISIEWLPADGFEAVIKYLL